MRLSFCIVLFAVLALPATRGYGVKTRPSLVFPRFQQVGDDGEDVTVGKCSGSDAFCLPSLKAGARAHEYYFKKDVGTRFTFHLVSFFTRNTKPLTMGGDFDGQFRAVSGASLFSSKTDQQIGRNMEAMASAVAFKLAKVDLLTLDFKNLGGLDCKLNAEVNGPEIKVSSEKKPGEKDDIINLWNVENLDIALANARIAGVCDVTRWFVEAFGDFKPGATVDVPVRVGVKVMMTLKLLPDTKTKLMGYLKTLIENEKAFQRTAPAVVSGFEKFKRASRTFMEEGKAFLKATGKKMNPCDGANLKMLKACVKALETLQSTKRMGNKGIVKLLNTYKAVKKSVVTQMDRGLTLMDDKLVKLMEAERRWSKKMGEEVDKLVEKGKNTKLYKQGEEMLEKGKEELREQVEELKKEGERLKKEGEEMLEKAKKKRDELLEKGKGKRDELVEKGKEKFEKMKKEAEELKKKGEEMLERAKKKGKELVEKGKNTKLYKQGEEVLEKGKEELKKQVDELKKQVEELKEEGERLKKEGEEMLEKAKKKVKEKFEEVKKKAEKLKKKGEEMLERAKKKGKELVEKSRTLVDEGAEKAVKSKLGQKVVNSKLGKKVMIKMAQRKAKKEAFGAVIEKAAKMSVKKMGKKFLIRHAAKLIPGLNILSMAYVSAHRFVCSDLHQDVYELVTIWGDIYRMVNDDQATGGGGEHPPKGIELPPECLESEVRHAACMRMITLCATTPDERVQRFCQKSKEEHDETKAICAEPSKVMEALCAHKEFEVLARMTQQELVDYVALKEEAEKRLQEQIEAQSELRKKELSPKMAELVETMQKEHPSVLLSAFDIQMMADWNIDNLSPSKMESLKKRLHCKGQECARGMTADKFIGTLANAVADAKLETTLQSKCEEQAEKEKTCVPKKAAKCSELKKVDTTLKCDGEGELKGTGGGGPGGKDGNGGKGGNGGNGGQGGNGEKGEKGSSNEGDTGGSQGTADVEDANGSILQGGKPLCRPNPKYSSETATCMDGTKCKAAGGIAARELCNGEFSNRCCFQGAKVDANACIRAGGVCMLDTKCTTCTKSKLCPGLKFVKCCMKKKTSCAEGEVGDTDIDFTDTEANAGNVEGDGDEENEPEGEELDIPDDNAHVKGFNANQQRLAVRSCQWKAPICPTSKVFLYGGWMKRGERGYPKCRSRFRKLGAYTLQVDGKDMVKLHASKFECTASAQGGSVDGRKYGQTFYFVWWLSGTSVDTTGEAIKHCEADGVGEVCKGTHMMRYWATLKVSERGVVASVTGHELHPVQ